MRIDFVDAGKAAAVAFICLGGIIGLTELFSWLEKKIMNWWHRKGGGKK